MQYIGSLLLEAANFPLRFVAWATCAYGSFHLDPTGIFPLT